MDGADIRRELLAMAEQDIRVRSELAADGSLFKGYHPRMQAVHDANAARLAEILDLHGWPGQSLVGADAAEAAWVIVQHAIAHPGLQRRALVAIEAAVAEGEAPAIHAAMLEDRIRCLERRPQRYGTQFDWDAAGEMSPLLVDDAAAVDARRRALGLPSLREDTLARRKSLATSGERQPEDWTARRQEMEEWCRRVGWRR
jgi:hypothetical protein